MGCRFHHIPHHQFVSVLLGRDIVIKNYNKIGRCQITVKDTKQQKGQAIARKKTSIPCQLSNCSCEHHMPGNMTWPFIVLLVTLQSVTQWWRCSRIFMVPGIDWLVGKPRCANTSILRSPKCQGLQLRFEAQEQHRTCSTYCRETANSRCRGTHSMNNHQKKH